MMMSDRASGGYAAGTLPTRSVPAEEADAEPVRSTSATAENASKDGDAPSVSSTAGREQEPLGVATVQPRPDGDASGGAVVAVAADPKIAGMLELARTAVRPALVVLGGSFCPPHAGHVAAMESARRAAEERRGRGGAVTVVGGYFAVAHDSHVKGKFKGRAGDGDVESFRLDEVTRLELCNLLAAGSEWLQASTQAFGSANQCGRAMIQQLGLPAHVQVIVVKGKDLEKKGAGLLKINNQTVSSSLVRETLGREGVEKGSRTLVQKGMLDGSVAAKLVEVLGARGGSGDQAG